MSTADQVARPKGGYAVKDQLQLAVSCADVILVQLCAVEVRYVAADSVHYAACWEQVF